MDVDALDRALDSTVLSIGRELDRAERAAIPGHRGLRTRLRSVSDGMQQGTLTPAHAWFALSDVRTGVTQLLA